MALLYGTTFIAMLDLFPQIIIYNSIGDYNHNLQVVSKQNGVFIPPRRDRVENGGLAGWRDYVPCKHCFRNQIMFLNKLKT